MIEEISLIGSCPLGKLYRRDTIDRFGFIFKTEYFKDLVPTWRVYTSPLSEQQYSYSDYVYYANRNIKTGEVIE